DVDQNPGESEHRGWSFEHPVAGEPADESDHPATAQKTCPQSYQPQRTLEFRGDRRGGRVERVQATDEHGGVHDEVDPPNDALEAPPPLRWDRVAVHHDVFLIASCALSMSWRVHDRAEPQVRAQPFAAS